MQSDGSSDSRVRRKGPGDHLQREIPMRFRKHIATTRVLQVAFLLPLLLGALPASPSTQISNDNIQAAMRTLNFLESLPKDGPISIGVVYPSDVPNAQAAGEATAQLISTLRGPNSRPLQPLLISTDNLASFPRPLDVLFLMAGASKHAALIADTMRRHQLVSISDDPVCAAMQCCVIMVRSGQSVEISLNTALAEEVGAHFSLVFTMMVKRQ
jgi:hypothetical protein